MPGRTVLRDSPDRFHEARVLDRLVPGDEGRLEGECGGDDEPVPRVGDGGSVDGGEGVGYDLIDEGEIDRRRSDEGLTEPDELVVGDLTGGLGDVPEIKKGGYGDGEGFLVLGVSERRPGGC